VGVIATQPTVRSRAYFQAIKDEDPFIDVVELATPELVPLVEAGQLEGRLVEEVVRRSLEPLRDSDPSPDTLLLGCTHYPLLAPLIEKLMGPDVAVIDSARSAASALAHLLEVHGLAAPAVDGSSNGSGGVEHVQLTTGDVAAFRSIAQRLFGDLFPAVEPVALAGAA
jgi:glutamate racemase